MNHVYSEHTLLQQPLLDEDQWSRVSRELDAALFAVFVDEFFEETALLWFDSEVDPDQTLEAVFRSRAHRTAGAAGTIGFVKLRHVFLCLEYSQSTKDSMCYLKLMREVFDQTKQWVRAQRCSI